MCQHRRKIDCNTTERRTEARFMALGEPVDKRKYKRNIEVLGHRGKRKIRGGVKLKCKGAC
jgi:hypothetical protein